MPWISDGWLKSSDMAHQLCTFKFLWNMLLQNCVEAFSIVLCVLLLRKEIVRSGVNLNTHPKFHAFNTKVDIWKECWIFSRTTRIMDFKILVDFFFMYTIIIFNWFLFIFYLKYLQSLFPNASVVRNWQVPTCRDVSECLDLSEAHRSCHLGILRNAKLLII